MLKNIIIYNILVFETIYFNINITLLKNKNGIHPISTELILRRS